MIDKDHDFYKYETTEQLFKRILRDFDHLMTTKQKSEYRLRFRNAREREKELKP